MESSDLSHGRKLRYYSVNLCGCERTPVFERRERL